MGQHVAGDPQDGLEVGVDEGVDQNVVGLGQALGPADTGIVHQDVDASERGQGCLCHGLARARCGHVRLVGHATHRRGGAVGGLRPGLKLLDRTFDFLRMHPLIERAVPILAELRAETGQRVDLSLFDDVSIIYAVRLQNRRETFVATLIGRRLPVFCSAGGRAMLACLQDDAVASILSRSDLRRFTPHTLIDPNAIRDKINEARRESYAFAEQEWVMGELALAGAVTDACLRPVAAIHIAGSMADWSARAFRDKMAPLVIEASRAISMCPSRQVSVDR